MRLVRVGETSLATLPVRIVYTRVWGNSLGVTTGMAGSLR